MHSAIKAAIVIASLSQHLWASPESVALVQGTSSMPNDAERRYGASVTKRLSRWLNEIPIPHKMLTDEALTAAQLRGIRVLILGYNPTPQPGTLTVLNRFVADGGKLIVFYGASPELANLMGLRLGPYMGASGTHHWTGMRFKRVKGGEPPSLIRQQSRSIRPVYPAVQSARIVATWDDERGKPSGKPAIVESPKGTWITHVLLDDGDTHDKKQILLTCVGRHIPEAWQAAAEHTLKACGSIGNYTSPSHAWQSIHAQVTAAGAPPAAKQHYRLATDHYEAAKRAIVDRRYADTVQRCQQADQELVNAVALSQRARVGERRGVWDHSGLGLYPGNWDQTCRELRKAGITDLYVNLLWAGKAHYPSKIVPRSRTFEDYGDQAAACVKAGRRHGIRIHAWKVCWNLAGASASFLAKLEKAGRLQVTEQGETIPWLCPSRADNVQYEVGAIREVARQYPVGGIHLDYIRYRDSRVCCCESCRRGFARDSGLQTHPWPKVLRTSKTRAAYNKWRCGRITHLVRETRNVLRETAPSAELSAAVFGKYPQCIDSVAQDWHLWLERNYVDSICPMNYTPDPGRFRAWLTAQTALPGVDGRILPGIGVTANESRLDPVQVIEQIRTVRQLGQPGYILFDLNQTLATETLPALSLGISAE